MRSLIVIIVLGLAGAGPALAQVAPEPAVAEKAAEAPLTTDDLGAVTGQGTEVEVLSDQQLSAASSGNSVVAASVRSGDIAFTGGALSGFAGVGNFVVNTGNNNNLQGAISVNIVTAAPQ